MKKVFYSIVLVLLYGHTQAQYTSGTLSLPTGNIIRCGFDEYQQELQKDHYKAGRERFERWLNSKIADEKSRKGTQMAVYRVPIVFHVIYEGTDAVGVGSNITAAHIVNQVQQLNADFGSLAGSTYGQAANTTLQFALAQRDPAGNVLAEPGIDRVNRNTKGFTAPPYTRSYVDGTIKANTYWDPRKYVNIWLVVDMLGGTGKLLGYATFPVASGLSGLSGGETDSTAGVAVLTSCVGSLVNPHAGCASANSYGKGRTLTHELGHFFGLRHIWGDNGGDCSLDDFCGDTPRAAGPNYGCSKGINSCNDITFAAAPVDYPDMVENYMDYADDACMNTFTADQKDRIVAVLNNSPRRKELLAATQGLTNTGQVSFVGNVCGTVPSIRVSEDVVSTDCGRYQDIPVSLQVFTAATGAATLTISTAGTATRGVDYDIIAGNTVTFAAGDNSQNIIVRIYDDAAPEGEENIRLSYNISGAGVTAATINQVIDLIIEASDQPAPLNENTTTLLSEGFDAGANEPAGWATYASSGALNRWTISPNGGSGTLGNAAHISNNYNDPSPPLRTNTYDMTATSRAVLSTPLINATDFTDLQLSFTWKCAGEQDRATDYDYGYLSSAPAGAPSAFTSIFTFPRFVNQPVAQHYTGTLPVWFNNKQFFLGFDWQNDYIAGSNPGFTIDQVLLTGRQLRVETQTSQVAVETVPANTAVRLISIPNRQLIAEVSSASENVSCLKGALAESGSGQVTLMTTNGSYPRSKKVIQLVPQVNSATVSYDVTLYFTSQEMTGWGNPARLKVLKVKDAANLAGTVNSQDAEILVPTVIDDQLAAKGYIAYTCRATGFSKFMLVQPDAPLPVTWLDFVARPAGNVIVLKWSTAMEQNNKGFVVERSTNGKDFSEIGRLPAAGKATGPQHYTLDDENVAEGTRYYYRLMQTDLNGASSYSPVRDAMISGQADIVRLYPNPVMADLFIEAPTPVKVTLQVLNTTGQVLIVIPDAEVRGRYRLDVSRLIPGVYLLKGVSATGAVFTQRWVKE